jgi:hypothetical protein
MIQPVTLGSAGLFFAVLYLRYRRRPQTAARRTRQQQRKAAKLLIGALVAWLAIHYSLQRTLAKMDGTDQEPSLVERAVSLWSK